MARTYRVEVRLSEQEHESWLAAVGELSLAEWVRTVCNQQAERLLSSLTPGSEKGPSMTEHLAKAAKSGRPSR